MVNGGRDRQTHTFNICVVEKEEKRTRGMYNSLCWNIIQPHTLTYWQMRHSVRWDISFSPSLCFHHNTALNLPQHRAFNPICKPLSILWRPVKFFHTKGRLSPVHSKILICVYSFCNSTLLTLMSVAGCTEAIQYWFHELGQGGDPAGDGVSKMHMGKSYMHAKATECDCGWKVSSGFLATWTELVAHQSWPTCCLTPLILPFH